MILVVLLCLCVCQIDSAPSNNVPASHPVHPRAHALHGWSTLDASKLKRWKAARRNVSRNCWKALRIQGAKRRNHRTNLRRPGDRRGWVFHAQARAHPVLMQLGKHTWKTWSLDYSDVLKKFDAPISLVKLHLAMEKQSDQRIPRLPVAS